MCPEPLPTRSLLATITVSDTRDSSTDRGGQLLRQLLTSAGFQLAPHVIAHDEIREIQQALRSSVAQSEVAAVILTGGTGISPRDVTVEALQPLLTKSLEGFGEAFRRLSWDQVGARSVLSRATAGVIDGRLVFALPAVRMQCNSQSSN